MNIMAGLETFLYILSTLLFFPVLVGLTFLTLWITICFGSFLREYLERRQGRALAVEEYKARLNSLVAELEGDHNLDIHIERLLQEAELNLIKSLDRVRFVIRVGPALGLMGTLIPMGIALSALAQGNLPKMAGSMVTAFTTVVVGLACSVAAYMMSLVKERWLRADIREMEFLTELTLRKLSANSALSLGKHSKEGVEDEVSEKTQIF